MKYRVIKKYKPSWYRQVIKLNNAYYFCRCEPKPIKIVMECEPDMRKIRLDEVIPKEVGVYEI